jgi:DNA polymerase I-like protein with 3'-5' exonuclease and polymerase domains
MTVMMPETLSNNALLTSIDELAERVGALIADRRPVAVDFETGYHGEPVEGLSLRAERNILVSWQFTNSLSWARMVPLGFDDGLNLDNKAAAALFWELANAVDDEGLPLMVAHNAFAELRWGARWLLRNLWDHPVYGPQVIASHGYYPLRSDTILERFVQAESPKLGLKELTFTWYGHRMAEIVSLFPDGLTKKQQDSIRFNTLDQRDPKVISYACEDVVWGLRHHLDCFPLVREGFIYKLEMQILPIVCAMSDRGLHVDWAYVRDGARRAREFEERMLVDIVGDFNRLLEEAGHDPLPATFNFNSSQQRAKLFHDWLGLPVVHWTDGGKSGQPKPSTDAKNALPKLAKLCPAIAKYWKYSKLNTLRTKFLDLYETKYAWADDGFAHCALLQYGTIAGRFSCEDFNYQQVSKNFRAELGDGSVYEFSMRSAIKAPPPGWRPWWELVLEQAGAPAELYPPEEGRELGWYILGFDYSQQELRVMASQANCTRLIADYLAGADVHRRTAALMLGVAEAAVTKGQRAEGKTRNFANIYGQGAKALADQLGIPLEEAYAKDRQYRQLYPELKPYRERAIQEARRRGYLITKFGRKITIHEYKDPNPKIRMKGDMTAGNAVIQGPATGDYPKIAMVRAQRMLEKAGLADKVQMVMNIHDALEFAVRRDVSPAQVIAVLKEAVLFPVQDWLPMVADWHMGLSWGQLKELELLPSGAVRLKTDDAPPPVPARVTAAVPSTSGGSRELDDGPGGQGVAGAPAVPGPAASDNPPVRRPDYGGHAAGARSRRVIVVVNDQPTREQAVRFLELLHQLPGSNTVVVQTSAGELPVSGTTGLTPDDEARVALILGAAFVHYDLDSVDTHALTRDLDL